MDTAEAFVGAVAPMAIVVAGAGPPGLSCDVEAAVTCEIAVPVPEEEFATELVELMLGLVALPEAGTAGLWLASVELELGTGLIELVLGIVAPLEAGVGGL
jgi:hypothetical protein